MLMQANMAELLHALNIFRSAAFFQSAIAVFQSMRPSSGPPWPFRALDLFVERPDLFLECLTLSRSALTLSRSALTVFRSTLTFFRLSWLFFVFFQDAWPSSRALDLADLLVAYALSRKLLEGSGCHFGAQFTKVFCGIANQCKKKKKKEWHSWISCFANVSQ